MNRRGFLKFLSIGTAVAAVALDPWVGSIAGEGIIPFDELGAAAAPYAATIGMYADYTNFSSFALASAIDDSVAGAAHELAHRAGLSVAELSA